jgi:hypothetical protein
VLGGVTSITLASDGATFYVGTHVSNSVIPSSLTSPSIFSFLIGTALSNVYMVDYATLTPKLIMSCHHQRINDVCFP